MRREEKTRERELMKINYPSELHEQAANSITAYFSEISEINAVLLTCSCARGKATKDSCLDLAILYSPYIDINKKNEIIESWKKEHESRSIYKDLIKVGKYSHIDIEFIDGNFEEVEHCWTTGPDMFEVEIGNFIAYSIPLYKKGNYFDVLKGKWLPYYNEEKRKQRLKMVKGYCLNNLNHIPLYVERKLFFQCFKRLYDSIGEFLQALFISNRIYPISYDKWIKDQIYDLIKNPSIYDELIKIMEYKCFESNEHNDKAIKMENLLMRYCKE
jgi:predicted nucleotidyltransferase